MHDTSDSQYLPQCRYGAHVSTKLMYVQMFGNSEGMRDVGMDESGEQSPVVFAVIVTEPASECVWSRFRDNLCKDDSALFSRYLHGCGVRDLPGTSKIIILIHMSDFSI
jgi:hypothetical protein